MLLCTCLPLKNENNAYCNQSAFVLPFNKKETLDNTAKHKITISISIRIKHIFIVWPKKNTIKRQNKNNNTKINIYVIQKIFCSKCVQVVLFYSHSNI